MNCKEHDCDEFLCRHLHDPEWLAEEEQLRADLGDKADDPMARIEWDIKRSEDWRKKWAKPPE